LVEEFKRRKKGEDPDKNFIFERISPEPNSGCWIWLSGVDSKGYGVVSSKSQKDRAHRISLSLKIGRKLVKGECACHKCDVPTCVNPEHLFVGTHAENMRDCKNKGRYNTTGGAKGEASTSAILNESDVRSIRKDGRMLHVIASQYGVHKSTIWLIKKRKNWSHIDD
jgi:hypothetical protein